MDCISYINCISYISNTDCMDCSESFPVRSELWAPFSYRKIIFYNESNMISNDVFMSYCKAFLPIMKDGAIYEYQKTTSNALFI